jgi:hypothetical protein
MGVRPARSNDLARFSPDPPPFFGTCCEFGHPTIGDAQSVILFDGTYMQANCCTSQQALLDATTLTWTPTGSGKFDINDEEGWNLLPNKQVLTVDAYVFAYDPNGTNSEIYVPAAGKWHSAGSTKVQLGLGGELWRREQRDSGGRPGSSTPRRYGLRYRIEYMRQRSVRSHRNL